MSNPTATGRGPRQFATAVIAKAKRFGTATVFMAGVVQVVEAAAAVWHRLVG